MVYDMGYVMSEAELVAAATQLDKNGDGKITYNEFANWWKVGEDRFEALELSERVQAQWAQAIDFFKYYDKDLSGDIDPDEFKPVYKQLLDAGHKLGTLEQAIATLDTNGDHLISLNEYIGWLVKLGALSL
ncbi:uncharacterized protein LOC134183406 isoform X2 [Corticium candelabrum]|nr:uncharacterized protein LOC134183406 isoform X2 [Corticium candelabrum]